jgi:hypothetical protein
MRYAVFFEIEILITRFGPGGRRNVKAAAAAAAR